MPVRTLPGTNLAMLWMDNTDWVEKSVESAMKDYFRERLRRRRFAKVYRSRASVQVNGGIFPCCKVSRISCWGEMMGPLYATARECGASTPIILRT